MEGQGFNRRKSGVKFKGYRGKGSEKIWDQT